MSVIPPEKKFSEFTLTIISPPAMAGKIFDLRETGLAPHNRAIEVGRTVARDSDIRLELDGLQAVHFYLKVEKQLVLLFHEAKSYLLLNGAPAPVGGWLSVKSGDVLDCGAGIQLRLASIRDSSGPVVVEAQEDPITIPVTRLVPRYRLRIKESRYELSGQIEFALREGEIIEIGRKPLSKLALVVNDPKVSEQQAYIRLYEDQLLLHDGTPDGRHPSRNGTQLYQPDGSLLTLSGTQPVLIMPGAIFRVGYTLITLEEIRTQ